MNIHHSLCNYLSCGFSFAIGIDNNKNIWSIGDNSSGQCGHDVSKNNISSLKYISSLNNIISVACGFEHSVCLNSIGDVYTFGDNSDGQLGIGNTDIFQLKNPQQVNIVPIRQISSGSRNVFCLSYENEVYGFGNNDYGQLGIIKECRKYSPIKIDSLQNISFIECGGYFITCIDNNNKCYAWGDGSYGQLGHGDSLNKVVPTVCEKWPSNIISIKCGYESTILLTENGYLYSCGRNNSGQLGIGDLEVMSVNIPMLIKDIPLIQKIECGKNHVLCIDYENTLWVWGGNYYGQLGLGDNKNRCKPMQIPNISNVSDISHGGHQTFIRLLDNTIYVFGNNINYFGNVKTAIPNRIFQDNEDKWALNLINSRQKSARK